MAPFDRRIGQEEHTAKTSSDDEEKRLQKVPGDCSISAGCVIGAAPKRWRRRCCSWGRIAALVARQCPDVDRIPDVRDGLDAIERRVLSLLGDRYVKCADVVSDAPSYHTLVALARDFEQRYPLVEGEGNFGSVDGDPPADPPYTAARLTPIARALPRFPNLLVNGSATIPPHNLREAVAAVIAFVDDDDIDVPGLMEFMPGPDFPTGGVIVDASRVQVAYETGSGAISLRARTHIEGHGIVVTELPYMVNAGGDDGVIRQIAGLCNEGRLPELQDIARRFGDERRTALSLNGDHE